MKKQLYVLFKNSGVLPRNLLHSRFPYFNLANTLVSAHTVLKVIPTQDSIIFLWLKVDY